MKSTGMVRRLDDLGRVVIPKQIRRALNIPEGALLEVVSDGVSVTFRKYVPDCSLCRCSDKPLVQLYPGKLVCSGCVELISNNRSSLLKDVVPPEELVF